jgi:hypothetical protein
MKKREMKPYDVAAYIWPSYTGDEPRTRMFWPEGNGEWETVRKATAKYPGHTWPRRPLWGYCNEADPYVMEMQIDAAADHGVNVFIYDWYWYDGRPFLEQCLNNGYLKARNNDRVKFYLMWANHDVTHLWDKRIAHIRRQRHLAGAVTGASSNDRPPPDRPLLHHPVLLHHRRQAGVHDLRPQRLVHGLGGVARPRRPLPGSGSRPSRPACRDCTSSSQAGAPTTSTSAAWMPGPAPRPAENVKILGFDSQTHYQIVHFTHIDRDYAEIIPDMVKEWALMDKTYDIPYFPHVSVGWDNNPRFQTFRPGVVKNNTPEQFRKALELARTMPTAIPASRR